MARCKFNRGKGHRRLRSARSWIPNYSARCPQRSRGMHVYSPATFLRPQGLTQYNHITPRSLSLQPCRQPRHLFLSSVRLFPSRPVATTFFATRPPSVTFHFWPPNTTFTGKRWLRSIPQFILRKTHKVLGHLSYSILRLPLIPAPLLQPLKSRTFLLVVDILFVCLSNQVPSAPCAFSYSQG